MVGLLLEHQQLVKVLLPCSAKDERSFRSSFGEVLLRTVIVKLFR